jgi:ornithine cyclodeaminase/alanine dehydrogenase-like protein (mu-crystallin family)
VAKHCAVKNARTLALVGCGFEGAMHLRFLTAAIGGLEEVRLRDVRDSAMTTLKERAAAYFNGTITVCPDNASCLEGAQIISTCTNGDEHVVRPEWFGEGAFAVGIEGGCAYTAEALHSAQKFIVDDVALAKYFDEIGRDRVTEDGQPDPEFPGGMPPIYATIGEIVAGQKPARASDTERIIAIPIGMAICDLALAHLAYGTARQRKIGQPFCLA